LKYFEILRRYPPAPSSAGDLLSTARSDQKRFGRLDFTGSATATMDMPASRIIGNQNNSGIFDLIAFSGRPE